MTRVCFVLFLLLARSVSAQTGTGALVSYQIDVFDITADPTGIGKALVTMTLPAGSALCNLAPLPAPKTLTQLNPQAVYWADPINVGKVCKLATPLLGTLPTLAVSNYVLTVTAVDDLGRLGMRSGVSAPFNNTAPLALTGVAVR